jgi:uncharacterized protein YlaI
MTNVIVTLYVGCVKLIDEAEKGMGTMRNNGCITVKCPSCRSTIQIKASLIRSRVFLCPVCEDGEIEYHPEPPRIIRNDIKIKLPLKRRELVTQTAAR